MQSQAQLNTLNAAVDNTLREEHHAPPCVLWEVYTGRAGLSQVAEAIGMTTVKTFGYETGWNFTLQSHQRAFLALQDEEMPLLVPRRLNVSLLFRAEMSKRG